MHNFPGKPIIYWKPLRRQFPIIYKTVSADKVPYIFVAGKLVCNNSLTQIFFSSLTRPLYKSRLRNSLFFLPYLSFRKLWLLTILNSIELRSKPFERSIFDNNRNGFLLILKRNLVEIHWQARKKRHTSADYSIKKSQKWERERGRRIKMSRKKKNLKLSFLVKQFSSCPIENLVLVWSLNVTPETHAFFTSQTGNANSTNTRKMAFSGI